MASPSVFTLAVEATSVASASVTPRVRTLSSETPVIGPVKVTPRVRTASAEAFKIGPVKVTPRVRVLSSSASSFIPPTSPELERVSLEASSIGQPDGTPYLRRTTLEAALLGQPDGTPYVRRLSVEMANILVLNDLAPSAPSYGTIEGTQVGGDPKGQTQVTLNWTPPTASELHSGEYLGDATGGADSFFVVYDPIAGDPEVYEVTGYTVGGGDTTLSVTVPRGSLYLTVTDPTNFAPNTWIEIEEGSDREYGRVLAVNGSVLTLDTLTVCCDWTTSATVKAVDVLLKTVTTDYTVTPSTGEIALVAGQFTASSPVFTRYFQTVSDLAGFEVYRIPGDYPYQDGAHISEVTGDAGVIAVNTALGPLATQQVEVLASTLGGSTHTYYVFSKDVANNYSKAQAVMIETITSQVQNLTTAIGAERVTLEWDPVGEANFNGVNIYRCEGTWDPSQAVLVNSTPVTTTTFVDGSENTLNRRPSVEVPYPVTGFTYYYVAETEDTVTDWDIGTQNESLDPLQAEVTVATKTD